MKKRIVSLLIAIVMVVGLLPITAMAEVADSTLTLNEAGYYEIGSAEDWVTFAEYVDTGDTRVNGILTADIDLTGQNVMIGTETVPYRGVFDGDNHTVTVALTNVEGEEYVAPFRYVMNAEIRNLTVDGTITSDQKFAAGIVGRAKNKLKIENCISAVEITSTVSGDGTHGGLVGTSETDCALTVNNCAFVGAMYGSETDSNGGLVGWVNDGYLTYISNSFVSAYFGTSSNNSNAFVRTWGGHWIDLTNCYYVISYGECWDGRQVSAEAVASGELAYMLNGSDTANAVWKQTLGTDGDPYPNFTGDTVYFDYETGGYSNTAPVSYTITVAEDLVNGAVSAPAEACTGQSVTVTVTPDAGYALDVLTVLQGENPVETAGVTFIMPAGDVTVSATFKECHEVTVGEAGDKMSLNNPFSTYYNYSVSQHVIPAELLSGAQTKAFTALQYYAKNPNSDNSTREIQIYLAETELDALTEYEPVTAEMLVYDGTVLVKSGPAMEAMPVELDVPYAYGGGNLLVTVVDKTGSYQTAVAFAGVSGEGQTLYDYRDNMPFDPDTLTDMTPRDTADFIPKMTFMYQDAHYYALTVAEDMENGTVDPGRTTALAGRKVVLNVIPEEGFAADTVIWNDGEDHVITPVNGVYSFEMPAGDVTVRATFRALNSYRITVDEGILYGTVEAPETAYESSTVTLTVAPDMKLVLASLTVMQGETPVEVSEDYSFIMPSGDVTVTATFAYPIWVGGTQLDPGNASDVFGDGTVSYDPATQTLTLNNYTYSGEGHSFTVGKRSSGAAIYSDIILHLEVIGENAVSHTAQGVGLSAGIYGENDLVFFGSGSLTATGCNASDYSFGICASGFIDVESGTLMAAGGSANNSFGIQANNTIDIWGGSVKASAISGGAVASAIHGVFGVTLENVELLVPIDGSIIGGHVYDTNDDMAAYAEIGYAERYGITVAENLENGTVTANKETAIAGQTVTLTVTPDEGYLLDTLTVLQGETPVEVSGDNTFLMPEGAVTVHATFRAAQSYSITISGESENGEVTAPESALEESSVTVTVIPDEGYEITALEVSVLVDGLPVPVETEKVDAITYCFVMPAGDVSIDISIELIREIVIGEMDPDTRSGAPFDTYYRYSVSQYVIHAEMLSQIENKLITDLTYYYSGSGETLPLDIAVYLQEIDDTARDAFIGGDAFRSLDGAEKVFEGPVSIAADGEKVELPLELDSSFYYGGGNLLVTVVKSADDYFSRVNFYGVFIGDSVSRNTKNDNDPYLVDKLQNYNCDPEEYLPLMKIGFADATAYAVSMAEDIRNGTVAADREKASSGLVITLTVTPEEGYALDALAVTDENGDPVQTQKINPITYTFTMPDSAVSVSAAFREVQSYSITVADTVVNGTVTAPEAAREGSLVTFTVTPEANCQIERVYIQYGSDAYDILPVDGVYSFEMPAADVLIAVELSHFVTAGLNENGGVEYQNVAIPLAGLYENNLVQYVIPAEDLTDLNGKIITDLRWWIISSGYDLPRTIKLYLSEIDSPVLSGFVPVSEEALVFDGDQLLPATASDIDAVLADYTAATEVRFRLDIPYAYQGGNLLVTVLDHSIDGSYTQVLFVGTSAGSDQTYSVYINDDATSYSLSDLATLTPEEVMDFIPATRLSYVSNESVTEYAVNIDAEIENGRITVSHETARPGEKVTVLATPDDGYTVETVTVTDGSGNEIELNDDGTYTMPDGPITVSAVFAKITGTRILQQPVSYVGKIGDLAEFTVVAEGEGLTYQWYYLAVGGEAWQKSSGTEATLTVEFKAHRNGQAYYCVITDAEGNQIPTKSVVMMAEEMELAFTAQPESYVGIVGDTVEFSAPATGNGLLYQWYYSTDDGASWSKSYFTGYDTATLQTVLRAYRNGYQYRCEVTDVFGNTITSDAAAMTVRYSDVTIAAQPENVENGILSQLYHFTVEAEGDNLSYQWQISKDGGASWDNSFLSGCDTAELSVRLYAYRDGYQYRCIVTSGVTNEAVSEAAVLNLQDATVAIVSHPVNAGVQEQEPVEFRVEATGMDLTYQWYRSNDGGNTWVKTYLTGYDTDTLHFTANVSRQAMYRCLVTDGSGAYLYSRVAKLTIVEEGLAITAQPEDVTCSRRETVIFTVAAKAGASSGTLKYQWYSSEDGGETWVESYLEGYNTPELSFVATLARCEKLYKCVISDEVGNWVETEPVSVTLN